MAATMTELSPNEIPRQDERLNEGISLNESGNVDNTGRINLKIEFGGGLELLFSNKKSRHISLPGRVPVAYKNGHADQASTASSQDMKDLDMNYLMLYMRDTMLTNRSELFLEESGNLRPGILVLINDTDWELEGEGDYKLQSGDQVVFISTLHGG